MVRVLHISGNMNMGGQETFIMNIYRNIDRSKIQYDFVVHSKKKGYYDKEIEKLGGKIYRITPISQNIYKHCKELKNIIKSGGYNIVHRHTSSSIAFIDLLVAKICKVKKRIVHSHSNRTKKASLLNIICRPFLNILATKKLACSMEAKKWLYGKKTSNCTILYNAIEIDKFIFKKEIREKIRKEYNCKDKFIIGHVGRFSLEKNHEFILKLFKELQKQVNNIELWLIGDGELKQHILNQAEELKIKNKIRFFGIIKNVEDVLQAMDIFIFPSIYEGLGISLIEAQISGLKCIVSKNIQSEAIITDNVICKELTIDEWKKDIFNFIKEKQKREIDKYNPNIQKFSMNNLIKEITDIYLK